MRHTKQFRPGRGASLADLTPSLQALGVFFVVTMGAAILRFRKRLD